jgi:predicted Ser/Thr protein kinase
MSAPKVIGRYEIVEELGRGAMGSVFKARDPAVGRTVAVKTIHSMALEGAQADEYRARFYREARASGVLAHPGIVPVFDVGEHEGAPFLVMEFVEGRTLAEAMKKGERYSLDRVCEIGQQLAEALGYAHRRGVIHRDIKPANILMTAREVYGIERPRITDFGIAKLAASEITTTGQLLGTPSFMPPEQFTGSPVDGRADLFSLGVILYSIATGEQPFPGETMTAVSYKVVYTEPIPPAKLNPAIPARLEAIILKCLAKSPADRYQTGEELARELSALRTGAAGTHAAPVVAPVGSDVTLGPGPASASLPPGLTSSGAMPGAVAASAISPPAPTAAAKKPSRPMKFESIFAVTLLAVAGAGAVVAGGWFWLAHRKAAAPVQQTASVPALQPAAQTQPPAPPPEANTPPVPAPAASVPTPPAAPAAKPASAAEKANTVKPPQAKPAPAPPQQTASAPPAAPAKPAAPAPATANPQPVAGATGSFDPHKLDPNKSARLKIDVGKFPDGLPFTVEMNRQPYVRFITGNGAGLDNLYVPPGIQQFRVSFKSGGQEWDSNIASGEFKAKKRKTLKVQLMMDGKAQSKIAVPISRSAQLFLSFSNSLTDNLPF